MDMTLLLNKLEKHVTRTGKIRAEKNIPAFIKLMEASEKLATRCICLQVISGSDKHLLKVLLEKGAWELLHKWLVEGRDAENVPFLLELLKIYVKLPVTLKLMSSNTTAKLIKALGKHTNDDVKHRSQKIVFDWKKIVRNKHAEDERAKLPGGPALFDTSSDTVRVSVHKAARSSNEHKPTSDNSLSVPSKPSSATAAAAVKTAPAKFRATGLEEQLDLHAKKETKASKQLKRLSHDVTEAPVEKKSKPESVSLSEAHSKVTVMTNRQKATEVHESSGFMDALTSSTSLPIKRKKRSTSKDSKNPTSPVSPNQPTPPSLYKDTLSEQRRDLKTVDSPPRVKTSESPNADSRIDVTEGVLREPLANSSAKRVSWASDKELVRVQYFEMDQSERVNVNRQSWEQLQRNERMMEGKALHQGLPIVGQGQPRLINDKMRQVLQWRMPPTIEGLVSSTTDPGCRSTERDTQTQREKHVLAAFFYSKFMLPESAAEPDAEPYEPQQPILIPLEDVSGESPVQAESGNGEEVLEVYDPEAEYAAGGPLKPINLPKEVTSLLAKPQKQPLLTADGSLNPAAQTGHTSIGNHGPQVNLSGIDVSSIMNMVQQQKAAAAQANGSAPPNTGPGPQGPMNGLHNGHPGFHGPRPQPLMQGIPMRHGQPWQGRRDMAPRPRSEACRFFANGFCRFGDACSFRHGPR